MSNILKKSWIARAKIFGLKIFGIRVYMIDCWLWDVVDCMCHEEEKIAGNTRDRGEKQGRARIRAGYFEPALVV